MKTMRCFLNVLCSVLTSIVSHWRINATTPSPRMLSGGAWTTRGINIKLLDTSQMVTSASATWSLCWLRGQSPQGRRSPSTTTTASLWPRGGTDNVFENSNRNKLTPLTTSHLTRKLARVIVYSKIKYINFIKVCWFKSD